jgi:tetratricopeptide (TPR) repeat protein
VTTPRLANPAASTNPADSARAFTEQGEAAFKAGDYKGAVYAWRHAIIDDPQNPVLLMMLAQSMFATGNFEEAAGATQAAMHIIPKDKWGVVVSNYKDLYGNVQDYTDQLRALEKAVKDKPDNPALRFLTGFHYAYLGFPKEAVDQLEKVIKIQPQDEMAKALRDEMRAKLPKPIAPPALPPMPEGPSARLLPKTVPLARAA